MPEAPAAPIAAPPAAPSTPTKTPVPMASPPSPSKSPPKPPAPTSRLATSLDQLRQVAEPPGPPVQSVSTSPTASGSSAPAEPAKPTTPTDPPPEQPPEPSKAAQESADGKRQSPWKLVNEFKNRTVALEREIAQLRERALEPEALKRLNDRLASAEARRNELEEHMRYVDYSRSSEYAEKYEKPYREAWARAEADMRELQVMTEDGNSRPATLDDLVRLANLPLGEARKTAVALFGDSADDVMAHRRHVVELAAAQRNALEEARRNGAAREAERMDAMKRIHAEVHDHWQRTTQADQAKYEWLRPKDGDDAWNNKLEEATKFVTQSLSVNAMDPRLTSEQRAEAVARQVAVRNRAIAFSMMRHINSALSAERDALKKELAELKASGPTNGEGRRTATGALPAGTSRMEQALQKLRSLAGP